MTIPLCSVRDFIKERKKPKCHLEKSTAPQPARAHNKKISIINDYMRVEGWRPPYNVYIEGVRGYRVVVCIYDMALCGEYRLWGWEREYQVGRGRNVCECNKDSYTRTIVCVKQRQPARIKMTVTDWSIQQMTY